MTDASELAEWWSVFCGYWSLPQRDLPRVGRREKKGFQPGKGGKTLSFMDTWSECFDEDGFFFFAEKKCGFAKSKKNQIHVWVQAEDSLGLWLQDLLVFRLPTD